MDGPGRPTLLVVDGGLTDEGEQQRRGADAGFRRRFARAMDGVRVVFQPLVWADRPRLFGYEALVRSTDPWLTGPLELFTAAEEAGSVAPLERLIRRSVAESMNTLDEDVPVFVNVHPSALDDPELTDADAPLTAYADRVVIEVTESAALSEVANLRDRIFALRTLGFGIAIDDLRAGYQSLRTFAEVNPDVVKFDMGLIRDVDTRPLHAELLSSTIEICRDLGIRTVGVGVETEAERGRLTALGCEVLQGFRFARPRWPPADIAW
ncbi:MAG: EAL domain-containing protein [Myxococcota bacterium]